MQEALPYKTWQLAATGFPAAAAIGGRESVRRVVSENAVIVVATRGCCMGHVVRRLLLSLGANPAFYEVEGKAEEASVMSELKAVVEADDGDGDRKLPFPAVFVGGKLFGGLDRVMAAHITGELTPVLKQAGALWL